MFAMVNCDSSSELMWLREGLISESSHVFNMNHQRIRGLYSPSRTNRTAGASGTAVMLVNALERRQIQRLAAHYKIEFEEMPLPLDEDIENLVAQRLVGQLEGTLRDRDRLQTERMQRFVPLVKSLAEDEDGVALLAMLLDDTYHQWMHDSSSLIAVEDAKAPKQGGGKNRSSSKKTQTVNTNP